MSLRVASLLLLILGLASASHYETLAKKYAEKKILESCFGEQKVKALYSKFYHSMAECKAEQNGETSARVTEPVKPSFDWQAFLGQQPQRSNQGDAAGYYFKRQKRHSHVPFNANKIREIKGSFLEKLKLGSCVLQKLKMLDANLEMNWPEITNFYQSAEVEPELKEDLMEVLDKCRKYVTCLTPEESSNGFPIGVKQAMKFMKCEKKMKCMACIKKDLRKGAAMFELEGLDGLLDGSPYGDADEQMMKVLLMQIKYGDNDFALFE